MNNIQRFTQMIMINITAEDNRWYITKHIADSIEQYGDVSIGKWTYSTWLVNLRNDKIDQIMQ